MFRRVVLRAYDEQCAITGLKLINGGGRAEADAAHIRPVEANGPDIVNNGIALSGTAHWMFDRGLIALSDDLTSSSPARPTTRTASSALCTGPDGHLPHTIRTSALTRVSCNAIGRTASSNSSSPFARWLLRPPPIAKYPRKS